MVMPLIIGHVGRSPVRASNGGFMHSSRVGYSRFGWIAAVPDLLAVVALAVPVCWLSQQY
jgi:hypothetical protein